MPWPRLGTVFPGVDKSGCLRPERFRDNSVMGNSGQAMIIAILSLGGAILGATTLAGFLLLYNIRATTNSVNSAKAIFAADAGLNWAF